jgi:hypothetical protein
MEVFITIQLSETIEEYKFNDEFLKIIKKPYKDNESKTHRKMNIKLSLSNMYIKKA